MKFVPYVFLLAMYSIATQTVGQYRYPSYVPSYLGDDHGPVYSLVFQSKSAALHFTFDNVTEAIKKHDWSKTGKTTTEIANLLAWLERHRSSGLVIKPQMLADVKQKDYASARLFSDYVIALQLQQPCQALVFSPDGVFRNPIQYEIEEISKAKALSVFKFFFEDDEKPFYTSKGIYTGADIEQPEEVPMPTVEVVNDKPGASQHSPYKKSISVKSYSAGITHQGDTIFLTSEKPFGFKGGNAKLNVYLSENAKFPKEAVEHGVFSAPLTLKITVMKDGSVRDVEVIGGSPDFRAEAVRLMEGSTGMWHPGSVAGKVSATRREIDILISRHSQ